MGRIVNLQYKVCPTLFKYILRNKREVVLDRWKLIYIHIEEKEIRNLINVECLKKEVEKVLNSPICSYCGTRATNGLLLNYRGTECIGRIINCPVCFIMDDKYFYKVTSLKGEKKTHEIKKFINKLA